MSELVEISTSNSSSMTSSGNLSAIKDCWVLNSKLRSELLILLEPTLTTVLELDSEKNPAQPTEPMNVIMIAITITFVTLPVRLFLILCIPDILSI